MATGVEELVSGVLEAGEVVSTGVVPDADVPGAPVVEAPDSTDVSIDDSTAACSAALSEHAVPEMRATTRPKATAAVGMRPEGVRVVMVHHPKNRGDAVRGWFNGRPTLPKVPDMSSMRTRVEETIEVIRPALHADGGDIVLRDVDEETGIVRVTLVGACGTCPTSTTTLKAGIERIMRDRIDGVTEVVNVPDLPEPSTLGEV